MGFTYKDKLQPFWASIFGKINLAHSIDDTKLNFLYLTMVFRKARFLNFEERKGSLIARCNLSYIRLRASSPATHWANYLDPRLGPT